MFYVLTWSYILHVCFAQTCVLDLITCLLTLLSLEMGEGWGGGGGAFLPLKNLNLSYFRTICYMNLTFANFY